MVWGVISERTDIRHSGLVMVLLQSAGLALVLATTQVAPVYVSFLALGFPFGWSRCHG
jgi:hypothetical protein